MLRVTESCRYAELQPKEIESSHFKYHLNQLINDDLVIRKSRGVYSLSDKGASTVDKLSSGRTTLRATPKLITCTLIHDDSQYYLYKKDKEPYRECFGFVGGKIHEGESSEVAAKRELQEKLNFTAKSINFCGSAEVRISKNEKLYTHAVAMIFEASKDEDLANKLHAIHKTELDSVKNTAPDVLPIITAIESGSKPFHLKLELTHL